MNDVKMEPVETPEQVDENNKRIDKFSGYAKDYFEANGEKAPNPCVMDDNGKVHWLNRKQRRAQLRKRAKDAKRNRIREVVKEAKANGEKGNVIEKEADASKDQKEKGQETR